ncbi:MAG: LysE family translocator [Hyphomicrobiaceae bacterium]|nr:LysE family translocator [Hyphomicrobiaceae bacterium]
MSLELLLAFAGACWLLALTPGPMMSLILANVAAHGLRAGLWTIAGSLTGLSLLVTAAALGMTSLMVFMSDWFDVIRWIGALYLAWLGLERLQRAWRGSPIAPAAARAPGGSRWFVQALAVSLSNPKVLLFLGAFLPQFVDTSGNLELQLAVLAVTFVVVIGIADIAYTLALGRVRSVLANGRMRLLDGASGVLLLVGGLVLATARRP